MKKLTKMMITSVVAGSVFAVGMVLAQGQGLQKGKNQGQQNQYQNYSSDNMTYMKQQRRGQGRNQMQNQNAQMNSQRGQGNNVNSTGTMGPGRLLRDEMRIVQIETLAELSGQSIEQVTADAQTLPMQSLVTKYNLDFNELEGIMHSKIALMVKNASDDGNITEEQALQMYTHMSTGPHGPHSTTQQ